MFFDILKIVFLGVAAFLAIAIIASIVYLIVRGPKMISKDTENVSNKAKSEDK